MKRRLLENYIVPGACQEMKIQKFVMRLLDVVQVDQYFPLR